MWAQDEEVRRLERANPYGDDLNASEVQKEPRRCCF
jgi:hypothetical protein